MKDFSKDRSELKIPAHLNKLNCLMTLLFLVHQCAHIQQEQGMKSGRDIILASRFFRNLKFAY